MFSSPKFLLAFVGLAGAIGYTAAQSISTQCEAGVAGLALNPSAACLNIQGLIGVVTAGSNTSLVSPINSWLGGFCSQAACSNDTLSTVVNTITSDCQTELSSLGISGASPAQLTTLLQSVFPFVKQIGCLQDQSNNTLCATETLQGYEAVNGPLTLPALETLFGQITSSSVPPSVPQSVECTNCSKAAYNILTTNFPGVINSDAQDNVQQLCGADFTNGQTPSGINSIANTDVQSSDNSTTNGAMAFTPGGAALSIILTVASVFTIAA
ncbi:hypothetical protein BC835DRAFT_1310136 [Cytidiella melzeri]|nr:hypothetical protein BC835DRAFT_1310136 [Cytidiella melzeri]